VLVVDKGRGVGGRVAHRRIGKASFDHGAQCIEATDPMFRDTVREWQRAGVVTEWYQSPPGIPIWRGKPTITAIAKHIARDLDLLLEQRIVSVRHDSTEWVAKLENGERIFADVVVLTPPVPQSLALLDLEELNVSTTTRERLQGIEYDRCLAVMAVLKESSQIPNPGGVIPTGGQIAWIADNEKKGVSTTPAVTIHATSEFSLEQWDRDRQEVGKELIQAAAKWLGSKVIEFQVHGWRYSKPIRVDNNRCLILSNSPLLLIAGDAFAGGNIEGATMSGSEVVRIVKTRMTSL